ncbi:TetR family transcriptional regulator [Sphingobium sp. H39-3-25]|uniref:TetR family transcriptional regulator n=1 Tax=Sphingobium arseniciresistens TaxID=3030834 RepID=UPI0023B927CF|nr:TetR family transcriptional regulator [Sphingobium arseniciresistens]
MTTTFEPKRRRRDPEASKAAILAAAFETFSERGYAGATLREIAARAGVTHGLLRKHFGSKEQLFLAALPGTRDWLDVVERGGLARYAETSATMLSDRAEAGTISDVLVALLRSGGENGKAAMPLYEPVRRNTVELYTRLSGQPDAELKGEMVLAFMLGLTFARHVIGVGAIAKLSQTDFRRLTQCALERLLGSAEDTTVAPKY